MKNPDTLLSNGQLVSACSCTWPPLLLGGSLVCGACRSPIYAAGVVGSEPTFSQREGERPPGCGRAKFLRAHRALVAAGDRGAWSEGRARLISRETWARFARDERPAPTPPASSSRPVDDDAAALASLGLARVGGGR